MVDRTRELELALGDGVKRIEANESETVVLQRRSVRLARDLPAGATLSADDLEVLRPAPADALPPYALDQAVGLRLRVAKHGGEALTSSDLDG